MQEFLIGITGVIVGTLGTGAGCYLGARLVMRAYLDVTNPHPLLIKMQEEEEQQNPRDMEGYDWDSYDSYIKGAEDDDGEDVPKA